MLDKLQKILQKFAYADAIITQSKYTSISMKDGIVESVREGEADNISIRVLGNNSFGFASSNKLNDFEKTAFEAKKLAAIRGGKVLICEPEVNIAKIKTKIKDNPINHSFEEKIKLLKEQTKIAKIGKVTNVNLVYYDANTNFTFINSSGALITDLDIRTGAAAMIFAKQGNLIENSFEQVKAKAGFEIMKKYPEKVENAAKEANAQLKAQSGPKGKMVAVLDPELAGVFAHEAIGHACEADGIKNESSILRGKLNRKIGSKHVTIKDSPIISQELWGSYAYDDEGTRAKGTTLVEKGVLRANLTSLETASEYRNILTGNARGDNSFRQIVRMSNTYFEKGEYEKDELFEGIKEGVYLVGCKEGQVSPKIGNFTFAAKYGYLIKNGKIGRMVRDCSINGNIMQSLNHIDAVCDDLEFLPGTCGKDGQAAQVTTGSPHLRIREILVG